jgi:hypothetical protein
VVVGVVGVVGAVVVIGGVDAVVEGRVEALGRCEGAEVDGVDPHPAAHTATATPAMNIAERCLLPCIDPQPMMIGVPSVANSHTTTESPAGTRTHPWLAG